MLIRDIAARMKFTPKQIQLLNRACKNAGIDSSKIIPSNPFEKSGSKAGMLQAAIAELDPAQAARWRVAAGGSLSVATMAELQSGEELSAAAQADLWNHDPEFVAEFQQQQEKSLEAQLKALERGAEEKRLQNTMIRTGGDERQAKRLIAAEDAENERVQQQHQGVMG